MAFHFPPVHVECGDAVLASVRGVERGVLGQRAPVDRWVLVTTAGFEHERAQAQRPRSAPDVPPQLA